MSLPNVAVIISNYNYGDYVLDAVSSALEQDYEGQFRIYVVDDGSSDGSYEKLLAYAGEDVSSITDTHQVTEPYYNGKMKLFQCSDLNLWCYSIENSGASTARNVAIWEAWQWADCFAILDADDLYHPSKVSKQVEKLIEYDEIGVTYSDYIIHKSYTYNDYEKHEYKYPYSKFELEKQCIVHSAGIIKKKYLSKILLDNKEFYDSNLHGPGSQEFIGCTEDYDLWIRLSGVCMMSHVAEPLSYVRETGLNQSMKMTSDIFQDNANKIRIRNEQIYSKN
ncbi:glycosyltransferase family 2 protein [Porticoccaceae bacterium]|nr:glycosyltransferase family 2 protein [Porticoccaceae bacterium]MDC1325026.1 glycosyltransferase family 2 protein [Ulvibacter sp.]|tara:strand:- start:1005 stop:1841 length:837 start_codon:yes stop_codon:yes gene_type:complete